MIFKVFFGGFHRFYSEKLFIDRPINIPSGRESLIFFDVVFLCSNFINPIIRKKEIYKDDRITQRSEEKKYTPTLIQKLNISWIISLEVKKKVGPSLIEVF